MDGALQLEEVAVGGIVLLQAQVDEVGERLHHTLLQGTLQHMPRVVAALHTTPIQLTLMMLKKIALHVCDKGTHLARDGGGGIKDEV